MQGDFFKTQTVSFGFYATSRHCIPRLSPRNSNRNEVTLNNGAAANCSGRQRASHLLLPAEPAAQQSRRALPLSAVSELDVRPFRAAFPDSTFLSRRFTVFPCLPHLMPLLTTH